MKVEIALARGKETRDKRRDIAERDAKRQIERALKERRLQFASLGATWFRRGRFSGRAASRGPRSAS